MSSDRLTTAPTPSERFTDFGFSPYSLENEGRSVSFHSGLMGRATSLQSPFRGSTATSVLGNGIAMGSNGTTTGTMTNDHDGNNKIGDGEASSRTDTNRNHRNQPHSDFMSPARFRVHAKLVLDKYRHMLTEREFQLIWLQLGLDRDSDSLQDSSRRTVTEVLIYLQNGSDNDLSSVSSGEDWNATRGIPVPSPTTNGAECQEGPIPTSHSVTSRAVSQEGEKPAKRFKHDPNPVRTSNLTVRMVEQILKVGMSKIPILTRICMDEMGQIQNHGSNQNIVIHEVNEAVPFPDIILFENNDIIVINKPSGKRVTPFHRLAEPTSCLNQVCSYILHSSGIDASKKKDMRLKGKDHIADIADVYRASMTAPTGNHSPTKNSPKNSPKNSGKNSPSRSKSPAGSRKGSPQNCPKGSPKMSSGKSDSSGKKMSTMKSIPKKLYPSSPARSTKSGSPIVSPKSSVVASPQNEHTQLKSTCDGDNSRRLENFASVETTSAKNLGNHSDLNNRHPDLDPSLLKLISEVSPLHRLDVHTSGVLLFAKNKKTAEYVSNAQFWSEQVKKFYYAIVILKRESIAAADMLQITDPANRMMDCELPIDGKVAKTRIKIISWEGDYALVRCELIKTGRTHQIRRHCANLGMPLLGDREYRHETCHATCGLHSSSLQIESSNESPRDDGIFFLHCHQMILPALPSSIHFQKKRLEETRGMCVNDSPALMKFDAELPDSFKTKLAQLNLSLNGTFEDVEPMKSDQDDE